MFILTSQATTEMANGVVLRLFRLQFDTENFSVCATKD